MDLRDILPLLVSRNRRLIIHIKQQIQSLRHQITRFQSIDATIAGSLSQTYPQIPLEDKEALAAQKNYIDVFHL